MIVSWLKLFVGSIIFALVAFGILCGFLYFEDWLIEDKDHPWLALFICGVALAAVITTGAMLSKGGN